MTIGVVTKYNKFQSNVMKHGSRQWDNPTAGNVMFVLATQGYVPNVAHETFADVGANYIQSGDGAPINATGLLLDDNAEPGRIFFASNSANFGNDVSVTAKYLICVQPVTPGTLASTAKLLWYVNLNTLSPTSVATSVEKDFRIDMPANGWVRI